MHHRGMSATRTERSTLRAKGQVTLPPAVRQALHVAPGDDVEFILREDGEVVVHGLKTIPADQAWFWTDSWQEGEQEASADIAAGHTEMFKDDDSFLSSLA